MRSSITIFLIGLVLGSTLGIGGIWTQVVQPAGEQIKQLNEEHQIMQTALDEAGQALREVAGNLRGDVAPEPLKPGEIIPRSSGGESATGLAPQPMETKTTTAIDTADRQRLADKLDALAGKLDAAGTRR